MRQISQFDIIFSNFGEPPAILRLVVWHVDVSTVPKSRLLPGCTSERAPGCQEGISQRVGDG